MRYPIVKISRFLLALLEKSHHKVAEAARRRRERSLTGLARLEVRRHQRLPFRYLRKGLLMGLVFVLVSAWIFSGFPRIWQSPPAPLDKYLSGPIPPEI